MDIKKVNMGIKRFITDGNTNGGASLNLNTGEYNPTQGYFVSLSGKEMIVDDLNTNTVLKYIQTHAGALAEINSFLGCWKHEGKFYLDVSEQITDLESSVYHGMKRGQKAIFDAGRGKSLYIPAAQNAGTETQKETYAKYAAQKFTESYKSKIK
jgi:hypothetical protein